MSLPRINAHSVKRCVGEVINFILDPDFPFEFNPAYQRGAVWSVEQKRNLWKSLLMGLPVGAVFINQRGDHSFGAEKTYHVVDGQQRLRALLEFRQGLYGLPRDWFEDDWVAPDYEGEFVTFDGLSRNGWSCIRKEATIIWLETTLKTEAEEAEMYLLINFGGVEQTAEDRSRAEDVAFSQEK